LLLPALLSYLDQWFDCQLDACPLAISWSQFDFQYGDKLLMTDNPEFDEDQYMFKTFGLKGKSAHKGP
jgi:hypothetical protein